MVPASSKSIQKGSTTTSCNRKTIWQDFFLRPPHLLSIAMQSWCFGSWTDGVGSCSPQCQRFSQIFILIPFSQSRWGGFWCLRAGIFSLSWPQVPTHAVRCLGSHGELPPFPSPWRRPKCSRTHPCVSLGMSKGVTH